MRALLLCFALAACAASDPATSYLANTSWVMTSPAHERPPTIEFSDDGAAGFAGCNRWFAQVTHEGGERLTFSGVGATRMMCPPPQMETERAFLDVLNRTRSGHYDRDALVLFDEAQRELARFERPR